MLVFVMPGGRRCVCAGFRAAPFPTPGQPLQERNAAGLAPPTRRGAAPAAAARNDNDHRGDRRPGGAARGAGERG
ncbi:hypothetical protein [Spirillospora sp. NPDC048819]|uniref:hypothetical protein n=1 Tax=Spirillospora sp. NPDC048819 TaxID=3155268 RepID=UPI0033E5FE35